MDLSIFRLFLVFSWISVIFMLFNNNTKVMMAIVILLLLLLLLVKLDGGTICRSFVIFGRLSLSMVFDRSIAIVFGQLSNLAITNGRWCLDTVQILRRWPAPPSASAAKFPLVDRTIKRPTPRQKAAKTSKKKKNEERQEKSKFKRDKRR